MGVMIAPFLVVGVTLLRGSRRAWRLAVVIAWLDAVIILAGAVAFVTTGEGRDVLVRLAIVGLLYYGPLALLFLPSSRRWFRDSADRSESL
jgi:hypothetical protein